MNRPAKHLLKIMAIIIVILGILYGGRVDYNESVLSGMGMEQYQYIRDRIGSTNDSKIVDEYMSNKVFYDSIAY